MLTASNLLITELMATNVSTLPSGDGEYEDWVEIHNAGEASAELSNHYLTDDLGDPTKWALPAVVLPAGGYLVVFASAPVDYEGIPIVDKQDGGGYYHTNFKLSSGGEELALVYEDPTTLAVTLVHQFAPEFPEQFPDVSYGLASDGEPRYFDAPTPGGPNGAGLMGVVGDTRFSVDRGFYDAPFEVEISSDTPLASIYYTTDGSAPGPMNGTLYSGALTIDQTTVLRAVATKIDYLATNVDTQTYLFMHDVLRQDGTAAYEAGFPGREGYEAELYGLDSEVVGQFDEDGVPIGGDNYGGQYAALLEEGLLSIPSISIVADIDDLFGDSGIYDNPSGRGPGWERPASVEWITADGYQEFQENAGLRIQGGYFRRSEKRSFRLLFKSEYGAAELQYPLFDDATDSYNTLVLRAGGNDGYSWGSARYTEQFTRDEFGRSLQNAAGRPSAHGDFAHLYINGVYWGLYNPTERPDAAFAAEYFGGEPENWDSMHADEVSEGDHLAWVAMRDKTEAAGSSLQAYLELQGLGPDGEPSGVAPLLNVESYIDYIAINVWGGNADWPFKNWWAGRDRIDATTTGFEFFNWDFENTMGNDRYRSPLDAVTLNQPFTSAGQPHQNLQANPEYRIAFADHVHKFFFNDGLLTPDKLIERYQQLADKVELAVVGESARWGDIIHSTPLTQGDWLAERDWILNEYLPNRGGYVMNEFKAYGLYPDAVAPVFSQHGGPIAPGFELSVSAPTGQVWYTLDGSDPRQIGGEINPNAILHQGGLIAVAPGTTVRARVLDNGEWSALNEAEFTSAEMGDPAALRVVELQYHPADFEGIPDDEDLEYLEILNIGAAPVSLDGVQIAGFASEAYSLDDGLTLGAGERIVVARNTAAFESVYGAGINLAPTGFGDRNLSNGGETVTLLGPTGQLLHTFSYSDDAPWPTTPDGDGPSLEIVDPLGDASDPSNWRASIYPFGSPGDAGLPIAGDYDASGVVDTDDYQAWVAAFGDAVAAPGFGADGNHNGVVDAADFTVWRDRLGDTTTLYGVAAIAPVVSLAAANSSPMDAASQAVDTRARQAVFALLSDSSFSEAAYEAPPQTPAPATASDAGLLLLYDAAPPAVREVAELLRGSVQDKGEEEAAPELVRTVGDDRFGV
ncbi:CotH protein [Pseudobythopirellula maris]|uniref:CotH protein n=1 Tax=Pseudobythopirellula maris TaxID=2527991 RepID=A0A5C5ZSB6_9BACT|nr:CotH kinase family protein [Pseudobythopirellula maris]TWT89857.1 CotH protein [Pseudobythopirellula maris]